jgi:Holliday junction resolvase
MPGKKPRQSGDRREREWVHYLTDERGYNAKRVPLSGSTDFQKDGIDALAIREDNGECYVMVRARDIHCRQTAQENDRLRAVAEAARHTTYCHIAAPGKRCGECHGCDLQAALDDLEKGNA